MRMIRVKVSLDDWIRSRELIILADQSRVNFKRPGIGLSAYSFDSFGVGAGMSSV